MQESPSCVSLSDLIDSWLFFVAIAVAVAGLLFGVHLESWVVEASHSELMARHGSLSRISNIF